MNPQPTSGRKRGGRAPGTGGPGAGTNAHADRRATLPWTLESLDLGRIERARIRDDEDLFFLLCSASYVRRHIRAQMTVKTLLKPTEVPARLQNTLERPLAFITGPLFLH